MSKAAEPTGSLSVALGHAQRLLERDARLAATQAAEILKVAPGHPHARLILGAALLGVECDEVIHSIIDIMYAKQPYTVIQRAMHILPTVTELIPTMLGELKPLE